MWQHFLGSLKISLGILWARGWKLVHTLLIRKLSHQTNYVIFPVSENEPKRWPKEGGLISVVLSAQFSLLRLWLANPGKGGRGHCHCSYKQSSLVTREHSGAPALPLLDGEHQPSCWVLRELPGYHFHSREHLAHWAVLDSSWPEALWIKTLIPIPSQCPRI